VQTVDLGTRENSGLRINSALDVVNTISGAGFKTKLT